MRAPVALILCLLAAPAVAQSPRPLDRGGELSVYVQRFVAMSGRRHETRGDCMSACSIFLGLHDACLDREAVVWFHSARKPSRFDEQSPWALARAEGNAAMLALYPPWVRAFVERHGLLRQPELKPVSAPTLHALGVPYCRD